MNKILNCVALLFPDVITHHGLHALFHFLVHLFRLTVSQVYGYSIGVADGASGGDTPQNSGKYFSGIYYVKFGHFSGKMM